MQFVYYLSLSFALLIIHVLFYPSLRPHLGQLFSPQSLVDLSHPYTFPTLLSHLLNVPFTVLALCCLIEKANKCLDFVCTTFFYHFLLTCILYRFPNTYSWYLWHALFITLTVLIAEFVCLKLETAEIKLSFGHIVQEGVKGA